MARARKSLDYSLTTLPPVWPGKMTPDHQRIRAPFKTPAWTGLLAELAREVGLLGGQKVEIAVDVSPTQLRQDGQLRADARPKPPVILSFLDRDGVRHAYPADRFGWWQDNLSAIARVMEDLRRAERYGVQSGLIRAGFKSLPSSTAATLSTLDAAKILADAVPGFSAVSISSSADVAKDAARRAMHAAHPDRHNGDRERWDRIERARSVLSSHHGVTV
jgi:hypothetical protein